MTIRVYELHGIRPTEIWEDYPFVPNVGDRISTDVSGLKTVDYRVFRKDYVNIIVK
jgi:hypothetical protein